MREEQLILAEWEVSPKIIAFSTTRSGGVSSSPYDSFNLGLHVGDDPAAVAENRRTLAAGWPAGLRWQWLDQVHSSDVVVIDEAGPQRCGDALITRSSDVVCCVQTADCLPLFVSAIDGVEVAIIHAGWKGLAAGIVENTVAAMATPARELAVWLGPAIGPCHFEVGAEVREDFLATASSAASSALLEQCFGPSNNRGRYMADLFAIARLKLSALGVQAVSGGNRCTYCDRDSYFSYRRDGVTGRMVNAIYIEA